MYEGRSKSNDRSTISDERNTPGILYFRAWKKTLLVMVDRCSIDGAEGLIGRHFQHAGDLSCLHHRGAESGFQIFMTGGC